MNAIPRKLGRYLIVREIGRGAMGVVYKAHDPVIEREVAIKAINLSFQVTQDEKGVYLNRFYREAKAAGKLNHPGIVTIYDVDEDRESSTPFIVMEYLEGTTLQDVMSNGKVLPIEQSTNIITQVAEALSYAHEHGVVHRDVKSANILILNGSKAKITDFGIARLPNSDLTHSGQFIGTPNYMSPEQIEGKAQVDGRSDLFSLGVIYYMLLTGERPFSGDSFNTVAYKIVNIDPLPPKALNAFIPEEYNAIVQKLLVKDPAQRYNSGLELVADLKRIQDPSWVPEPPAVPIAAPQESPPDELAANEVANQRPSEKDRIASSQTITLFRRHHAKWTLFAAGLILLISAIAGSAYFFTTAKPIPPAAAKLSPPETNSISAPQPVKTEVNQDLVRRKWDLAQNYFKNGLYDKSIEELHAILLLNPNDEEAKKYLDLATNLKEKTDNQKQKNHKTASVVQARTEPSQDASLIKTKTHQPKNRIVAKPQPVTPPINVDFELVHSFPSGVLNIYLGNKLIYQSEFQGTKKKVFLFKNYQGTVNGSFMLPAGDSHLQIQLVSKEVGISLIKDSKVTFQQGAHPVLKMRYIKTTKQLELKWI